jgi:surface polysaccharide O-acyltransferase-like enzyme
MSILNSKVYVITSPLLAQAALRHKDLDFTTFVTGIALRPFGLSQETIDKIRKDSLDRKVVSYMTELHKLIYERLGPGLSLDEMNARMLSRVAVTLNSISDVLEVEELWPWLQKTFTLATTYSLYGEHDPFSADPSLFRALWYVNLVLPTCRRLIRNLQL